MCVNLRITFTSVKHDLICPRVLIGSNKVNNNNNNNNNNNKALIKFIVANISVL